MVYNWLRIDQIFRPGFPCLLCGADTRSPSGLCPPCQADLPRTAHPCPRCGEALPAPTDLPCGRCLRRPPPFDTLVAALAWETPVPGFVGALKFRERLPAARLLGHLLAEAVSDRTRPDCLLPVPLHAARLRQRGFNQAVEIARFAARRLDLPLLPAALRRIRPTPPQQGLDAKARRRNLRGAFELAAPLPGSHVAIVDDVVTTGSTVGEIARLLRRTGAERVVVWAAARATKRLG